MKRLLLALVLILGAATIASSHSYLNSTESGCDGTDPNVIWCEDFQASDAVGLTPAGPGPGVGVWASENCDTANFNGGSANGIDTRTKGWCMAINPAQSLKPWSFCSAGIGFNGQNCVGQSILQNGADGGDSINGSHNFGPTPSSSTSAYRDVWIRFYYKRMPGYVFNGNQKFITWQNYKRDNGGIFLAGIGDCGNGGTSNCACPVQDCQVLGFRNPQNPVNADALAQNTGNTINVQTLVNHWLFMEQHVRINDNGVQNGILEVWINDCGVNGDLCTGTPTKRLNYTNLRYIPGGNGITSTTVGQIAFDIWGNPSDGGTIRFAYIKASKGGQVGFLGTTALPAPGTPTNAKVCRGTNCVP